MKFILSGLLVLLLTSYTWAKDCQCERRADDNSCIQGYCIHKGESQDVVYYLHGGQGTLENWSEDGYYPAQIRAYWSEQNLPSPTVVGVTYGPSWLLASPNSSPSSGLFEDFELRMRPKIEASLSESPRHRVLIGESMGAFNTLQLALRTPHYSKAAVLCAVVGDHLSPFSSEAELLEALRQSTAYKYHGEEGLEFMLSRIQGALHLARHFYPTLEEWNEFDPMSLALTSTTATDFYIASGFHDAFASYEGNVKLAEVLESKGLKVDWRPQWGGHCAIDIPSLARFLVE